MNGFIGLETNTARCGQCHNVDIEKVFKLNTHEYWLRCASCGYESEHKMALTPDRARVREAIRKMQITD